MKKIRVLIADDHSIIQIGFSNLLMPQKDGIQATAELVSRMPGAKILILTSFGSTDDISKALQAGAANRTEAVAIALRKHLLKI